MQDPVNMFFLSSQWIHRTYSIKGFFVLKWPLQFLFAIIIIILINCNNFCTSVTVSPSNDQLHEPTNKLRLDVDVPSLVSIFPQKNLFRHARSTPYSCTATRDILVIRRARARELGASYAGSTRK